jgi:predicted deacylase
MITTSLPLPLQSPGASHSLTVHRFGRPGARPQVYIQAALHADEIPGMLCAVHLRERLAAIETEGALRGEIVLVPVANPFGLGQTVLGHAIGRFALGDGGNFNRDFPDLEPGTAERVRDRLGRDPAQNVALVRAAMAEELAAWPAETPVAVLKKTLVGLALGADLVLDLHCDAEGAMHLYTLPTSAGVFAPLGAWLGSKATLVAEVSGGDPFDEVFSRPWVSLAARFPDVPLPLAAHAVTVELRGQADVDHALAKADAAAIIAFLSHAGALAGTPPTLPGQEGTIARLDQSETLTAPHAGIVVFRCAAGDMIRAGDPVVDIVDPLTGAISTVLATSSGVLFARNSTRFATPGKRLGKIAGDGSRRSGKLLGL